MENILLENTKDEMVMIVDKNDNIIGENTRKEMRKHNLIHRYTSIIVSDQNNNILIQKRAKTKEYYPSFLDLTIGGVVSAGEENVHESAIRELDEEIGVKLNNKDDLKYLGKFYNEDNISAGWSYVYSLKINTSEVKLTFSDGEVEEVYWLTHNELIGKIKKDERITPDSIEAYYFFLDNNK